MNALDLGYRLLDFGHGPIGRGRHIGRGTGETPEGVFLVSRVAADTGHYLGMGRLDQEPSDPADEGRHIG
jgi:hypothetical protein